MKFENVQVMNFKNAFRGMRHPKESYHLSDSVFKLTTFEDDADYIVAEDWANSEVHQRKESDLTSPDVIKASHERLIEAYDEWLIKNGILQSDWNNEIAEVAWIGPKDMRLAQNLVKAGPEHMKFMRQIFVSVDITAPLFWWKEFDTYKVGTTANSTSTMHKLAQTPITLDCFEIDDYKGMQLFLEEQSLDWDIKDIIDLMEALRKKYLETEDIRYWKELIRWLPESWLQTRTVTLSYANLRNIYFQRRYHKLTEWHSFCEWVKTLPYAEELIILE